MRVYSNILLGTEKSVPEQREWKNTVAALKSPSRARAAITSQVPDWCQ